MDTSILSSSIVSHLSSLLVGDTNDASRGTPTHRDEIIAPDEALFLGLADGTVGGLRLRRSCVIDMIVVHGGRERWYRQPNANSKRKLGKLKGAGSSSRGRCTCFFVNVAG